VFSDGFSFESSPGIWTGQIHSAILKIATSCIILLVQSFERDLTKKVMQVMMHN